MAKGTQTNQQYTDLEEKSIIDAKNSVAELQGGEARPSAQEPMFVVAGLNHARDMLIHAANLRTKNFNYFLGMAGVIVALYAQSIPELGLNPVGMSYVAVFGMIVSVLFLGLDIRTFQLIKDARDDLEKYENIIGLSIHTVDQVPDSHRGKKGSGRRRFITSHTFGYRAMFTLMALTSFIVFFGNVQKL